MKKILLIGNCPLPEENSRVRPAAGLRTWQFASGFLREGGRVIEGRANAFGSTTRPQYEFKMVNIAMPECYEGNFTRKEISNSEMYHLQISKDDGELMPELQGLYDKFLPDAVVSVNTYPSYVASQLEINAPLWADLNGWIMSEAQAQAYKLGSNDMIPHYMEIERTILKRADKISCVSKAQQGAILGELAQMGRLNNESFGYEFTEHIANGTEWFGDELMTFENLPSREGQDEIFKKVPEDAFTALWLGGYNTWVDELNLFKGVEDAMAGCEKLYYVSTGGSIDGLDNKTFAKFKKMVDESRFKDRFIFLGWVNSSDIPYIYKRADIGLNVDRRCAETLTGARNRINEMMKYGVPVVSTLGSEISFEMEKHGGGIGVKNGKHEELTAAIVKLHSLWRGGGEHTSREFLDYGKSGQKYIEEQCNYERLMKPLMSWLENPRPAPDRGIEVRGGIGGKFKGGLLYFRERGLKKGLKKVWQKIF